MLLMIVYSKVTQTLANASTILRKSLHLQTDRLDVLADIAVGAEDPIPVSERPILAGTFSPTLPIEVHKVDFLWAALGAYEEPSLAVKLLDLQWFPFLFLPRTQSRGSRSHITMTGATFALR